jgi:hypothetical protein
MLPQCLAMLLLSASATADGAPILANGGFETLAPAHVGADGLSNGWRLAEPQVPAAWALNSAYPGELAVCRSEPGRPSHGGQHFVRLSASENHDAHLYQLCRGLEPGRWYRVSAWVRGGALSLAFYEYLKSGKTSGQGVAEATEAGDDWRLLTGFYRPPAEGFLRSALALCVHARQRVDVDDVSIEALPLPEIAPSAADVVLETDLWRLVVSPQGMLRELREKTAGRDCAAGSVPFPILQIVRRGVPTPVYSLVRRGDRLEARFLDPEIHATLRITSGKRHVLLEVVDVQPADVEQLTLEIPLRRLTTLAGTLDATYDDQFGVCLWGTTVNTYQQIMPHGAEVVGLAARATRRHGIAGARFALVAAPRDQFTAAMMDAERATGLPCPMLEGRWARDSQPVRRSYLFVVDAQESNIEKLIEYARIGHFGTIIFLKENWLANHGHYQVNTRHFPDGTASLKRAVAKIHAAGLGAGVHVCGPSISPNDPYVTPRPDDRLAAAPFPPLAEAVDAKSTTLALAGRPELLSPAPHNDAFPGSYLRIGDEIIRYQELEPGPPPRFVRCQRGALGTRAAPHPAGSRVKALLALWSYFLVDPDSTLADELTTNFAAVFNACDFDMVYFDASDGIAGTFFDRWYYLNKLHLGYYRKFKKDVLYQTSNGPGTDLTWHIVPRSASADGHGDLKRYLDERLPGMLTMAANFTHADVGWYYMYNEVRPDQIEYVCAKTIGLDGSISIETSQAAMEKHPRARQMLEMAGRYERCRLANFFPESIKARLREPGRDFQLFEDRGGWKLWRASYEEPRFVEALDGRQNTWTIRNDQPVPCPLGVEIACGFRNVPTADFDQPGGVSIDRFDDLGPYQEVAPNLRKWFLTGQDATITGAVIARSGVEASLAAPAKEPSARADGAVLRARNNGAYGGWCVTGRRLARPLDLSRCQAVALWVNGDGEGETLRVEVRDAVGRAAHWTVLMSFKGWRLCVFPTGTAHNLDWSKTDLVLFRLQGLAARTAVRVGLRDFRALRTLHPAPPLVRPVVTLNGRPVFFPVRLEGGQAVTSQGPGGVRFWPGGMQPGQPLDVAATALMLAPGDNQITFTADTAAGYPGDVNVLLYRLGPLR